MVHIHFEGSDHTAKLQNKELRIQLVQRLFNIVHIRSLPQSVVHPISCENSTPGNQILQWVRRVSPSVPAGKRKNEKSEKWILQVGNQHINEMVTFSIGWHENRLRKAETFNSDNINKLIPDLLQQEFSNQKSREITYRSFLWPSQDPYLSVSLLFQSLTRSPSSSGMSRGFHWVTVHLQ